MNKIECPECGAMQDIQEETEDYTLIDCWNCQAVLEYIDEKLQTP